MYPQRLGKLDRQVLGEKITEISTYVTCNFSVEKKIQTMCYYNSFISLSPFVPKTKKTNNMSHKKTHASGPTGDSINLQVLMCVFFPV